jgi:FKBP-type peptidyl-prolyl cis-trans isomerase 2
MFFTATAQWMQGQWPLEKLSVGDEVRMATGNKAFIHSISDEELVIDYNSQAAGKALTVDFEVLHIMKAGTF